MVLVFILIGILIILLSLVFIILISTLHIEIKDLEATNIRNLEKDSTNNTKNGYAIILSLYLCNKLRWISIHLNDEKLRKAYTKMQLEKFDIKKLEQDFKWEDLRIIKNMKLKISYLNLKAKLGTESPIITAFLITLLSSFISIFLPFVATDLKKQNYQYVITPIYQNQNLYKINFNCIIQVKMVHIINAIYILVKRKERSKKNGRTTSNRGSYGYSYE